MVRQCITVSVFILVINCLLSTWPCLSLCHSSLELLHFYVTWVDDVRKVIETQSMRKEPEQTQEKRQCGVCFAVSWKLLLALAWRAWDCSSAHFTLTQSAFQKTVWFSQCGFTVDLIQENSEFHATVSSRLSLMAVRCLMPGNERQDKQWGKIPHGN